MKIVKSPALALMSLFCSLTAPFAYSGQAGEGGGSTGGGDSYAAHFAAIGKQLNAAYKLICNAPAPNDSLICRIQQDFSDAVSAAHILPREILLGQDGQPREAGPNGKGDIELNTTLYKKRIAASGSAERTVALVAHEYMIIARQEQADSYVASATLMSSLRANHMDIQALVGPSPVNSSSSEIKGCKDHSVDLRSAAVGFRCRTSKGSIFERVARVNFGEAWRGPDGLIWGDFVRNYSQYDAIKTCQNLGGTLPSLADFERDEANGFREALPNMKDRWFWLSSVDPSNDTVAAGFDGGSGDIGGDFRSHGASVRCIAH